MVPVEARPVGLLLPGLPLTRIVLYAAPSAAEVACLAAPQVLRFWLRKIYSLRAGLQAWARWRAWCARIIMWRAWRMALKSCRQCCNCTWTHRRGPHERRTRRLGAEAERARAVFARNVTSLSQMLDQEAGVCPRNRPPARPRAVAGLRTEGAAVPRNAPHAAVCARARGRRRTGLWRPYLRLQCPSSTRSRRTARSPT